MSGAGECMVDVVVVTWNSAGHIDACLDSVERQHGVTPRITVVDNGSADDGPERVRRRRSVRLIELPDNRGFCEANNVGIGRGDAPFVLVLNPDTVLEPTFLQRLLPAFDDPRVGIACGKLLRFDRTTIDSAGQLLGRSRKPVDRGYGEPDDGRYDRDGEVFGACAAAALYRRAMLDDVADSPGTGYFDERFFAFYEDLDLAWRARRRGWTAVYVHAAVGLHARSASGGRNRLFRRFAALLNRPPEIRYHIAKNRYLTILRNDRPGAYLKNLPWILGRDLGMLALLAVASPSVLVRLWRARREFGESRRRGRLDAERARP